MGKNNKTKIQRPLLIKFALGVQLLVLDILIVGRFISSVSNHGMMILNFATLAYIISFVGYWLMKKWGVCLYFLCFLVYFVYAVRIGDWDYFIPHIFVIFAGARHFKNMH